MAGTSDNTRPTRILVVDDDFHACQILQHTLSTAGYEPTIFRDPLAIDPLAIAWQYPIAVLDFMMPGLSGLNLFRRIREHDPVIDAIILTGQADYADAVEGYRIGVASWVVKPWSREILLAEIARVLRRQEALLKRLREEFAELDFTAIKTKLRATEAVAHSTREQIQALREISG